jgi:hypothetical protein
MKWTPNKVIFALVILAGAAWWAHNQFGKSKTGSRSERGKRDQESTAAVAAAAARYNATADWEKQINERLIVGPFSLELEKALMANQGKPIVISGDVEDVTEHDGHYYVYVNDWSANVVNITFVLECDAATAARIIEKKDDLSPLIAITQITRVRKAQLELKSGLKTSEDPVPVEIDYSSLFMADGKCIEIIFPEERK